MAAGMHSEKKIDFKDLECTRMKILPAVVCQENDSGFEEQEVTQQPSCTACNIGYYSRATFFIHVNNSKLRKAK